jgi:hypothetical protein
LSVWEGKLHPLSVEVTAFCLLTTEANDDDVAIMMMIGDMALF